MFHRERKTVTLNGLSHLTCLLIILLSGPAIGGGGMCVAPTNSCVQGSGCTHWDETSSSSSLPMAHLADFEYAGAFTFPDLAYGASNMNFADGVIEKHGDTLYVVGNANHSAIAQFEIPDLVNSTDLTLLNSTGDPKQVFSELLNAAPSGNLENINQVTGMEVIEGKLVINAHEYYDGSANNTNTTLVVSNADDISNSDRVGFLNFPGGTYSGGWISAIPPEWQALLNGTYITGFSSATPIISRHSVGPSAHSFYPEHIFSASESSPDIATTKLMEFSLTSPMGEDIENIQGDNDLWTIITGAWYAFIVPGTRTYAAFGYLAGADSGIGYKTTQINGNVCGGYCQNDPDDIHPYYWLFNVEDLLQVGRGNLAASDVRPYEYGKFPAPFQPETGATKITGGTFDSDEGLLYLTLDKANTAQGPYSRTPVVVAYKLSIH